MHNKPHTAATKERIRAAKLGKPAPWRRRACISVFGVTLWQCGHCRQFLPADRFHKSNRTLLGLKSDCKQCHSEMSLRSRDPENTRRLRREAEARRRARKAGATGHVSAEDMLAISSAWGAECLRCGTSEDLQWDHVVPLARGGSHCISNLQRLCRSCNEIKQSRDFDYRSGDQKVWAITFKRLEEPC